MDNSNVAGSADKSDDLEKFAGATRPAHRSSSATVRLQVKNFISGCERCRGYRLTRRAAKRSLAMNDKKSSRRGSSQAGTEVCHL